MPVALAALLVAAPPAYVVLRAGTAHGDFHGDADSGRLSGGEAQPLRTLLARRADDVLPSLPQCTWHVVPPWQHPPAGLFDGSKHDAPGDAAHVTPGSNEVHPAHGPVQLLSPQVWQLPPPPLPLLPPSRPLSRVTQLPPSHV